MKYATGLVLLICCFAIESTRVCKQAIYYKQRWERTKACGWWWKKRCHVKYFYKRASYEVCCDGHGGDNCDYYICGGKTNQNGACQTSIVSGRLIKKDGSSVTSSDGTCTGIGECTCNKGFYSQYGLCNLCPQIENCDYEECTNRYDVYCSTCNGSNGPETCNGCNAFRRSASKKSCIELCSWRRTSTPCWPGKCGSYGYKRDCKCHDWFTGEKCLTITKPPSILRAYVKLTGDALVQNNPNEVSQALVLWTNAKASRISLDSMAQWKTKLPVKPKYISSDSGKTYFTLSATLNLIYHQASGAEYTSRIHRCTSSSSDEITCAKEVDVNSQAQAHGASITAAIDYVVNGRVTIINQDNHHETMHNFNSATSRFRLTFRWDLRKPYTSYRRHLTLSTEKVKSVNRSITAYWSGWRDDDSGLKDVTVGINRLVTTGNSLQDPCGGTDGNKTMSYYKSHWTFSVSKPGVYSVILTVLDKAGNHERARTFFTYDPDSTITTKDGTNIKINGTVNSAAINWLTDLHNPIILEYSKDRYVNLNYTHGKWLGEIQKCHGMKEAYDGAATRRTTEPIRNNQGIVKMKIGYALVNQPNIPIRYSDVDIFSTKTSFNISRSDGDIIKFSIKVMDYMDRYFVEDISLRVDTTPPVINDVWLTRNGTGRLAVHNSDDLRSMIFEWEAYDLHSGLREVSWSFYDNQTDSKATIHHGNQSVGHQGLHKNLATCKSKYANASHGPDCYCVPLLGCFHKNFEFKPFVAADNGIHPNRTKGEHDGDYFVEVKATNWAMLESKVTMKVTIDTSPPSPGQVVDGLSGEPDVDYQSTRMLTAHWRGFSDPESGIVYYQFSWGNSCADDSLFGINYDNTKVKKTSRSSTKWAAPAGGQYFIKVAAFNAALDHSVPVCSSGVMVDETGPVFGGLTVENTKTIPGLVKDNGFVYFVGVDRKKIRIRNPSRFCIAKATNASDTTIYQDSTFSNGTKKTESSDFCEAQQPLSLSSYTPLTKDGYISVNWTAHDQESGIESYQFGMMTNPSESQAPDILPYEETNFGNLGHYKRYHPGLSAGRVFYIGLKATNKAMLMTTKVFGPFVVEVTPPKFNGKITVRAVQGEPVPTWNPMDFIDGESAGPHKYEVAVGTTKGGTDVLPWSSLSQGAGCQLTSPPGCTHINMKSNSRKLHSGDSYYVSIKVTNFAGLYVVATSDVVQHFSDPPAKGVVIDVALDYSKSDEPFLDRENDIDYQLNATSLKVSWYGFERPYNSIKYRAAVGTFPGGIDVASPREVSGSSNQFDDLKLSAYKTYYTTIWASNGNGEVHTSSDGVTVLRANDVVDAKVYDGPGSCSLRANESSCGRDVDYQASTSSIFAHWSISSNMAPYITVVLWKIEQQKDLMDPTTWVTFEPFLRLSMTNSVAKSNLGLVSGKRYRSVLRLCHGDICFDDVYSDGVLVLAKPPAAGSISVKYEEPKTIKVMFDRFVDADIPELYTDLSRSVIDVYEWTVALSSAPGHHIADWKKAEVVTGINQAKFDAVLDQSLNFKTCYRLVLRGSSKAGLSTTISKNIKDCNDIKPFAPVVIDAYGQPVLEKGAPVSPRRSQPISKKTNEPWSQRDRDFTPYANMLSATWPSLRHGHYTYAVILDETLTSFSHYHRPDKMVYKDPCSLPTAIKCGNTGNQYTNIAFDAGTLVHGKRYYICIHASAVNHTYEEWTETLAQVNACSDGITLDLTDPKPGKVWFGTDNVMESHFHMSTTEVVIRWSGFVDFEEEGKSPSSTGIKYYEYALGTQAGVPDILNFTNVGMTDRAMLHGLRLQDGHTYYAMIRATDYVNRTSTAISAGVTIDTTPPIKAATGLKSDHNGTISASWDGIFSDAESGISHYEWSVGSKEGYADIIPYTMTSQTSAFTGIHPNLHEGHVYYMSVKAFNNVRLSSLAVTLPVLYDVSPPVKGYVFDGKRDQADAKRKDKNFQRDSDHIWAHWDGFTDPHSGIASYSWSVGTCFGCDDVLRDYPRGTNTNAVATDSEVTLRPGQRYYITVTACNDVGLCTSASSDGLIIDNTPPIVGSVQDGVDVRDTDYQLSRNNVGVKWWGFLDPHSGISHFSWWIGTTPGGNDLMKEERLHHTEMAFMAQLPGGVQLPVDNVIYNTIGATNRVGLSSNVTSDGFKVVTSAPNIVQPLTHLRSMGSFFENTQIFGTVLGVKWKFADPSCPIGEQYIRLRTDGIHTGNVPTVRIGNTVTSYYFTSLSLHDGTMYYASVTACNLAKLCNTSTSEKVLVDNTPPLTGSFRNAMDFTWNSTSLSFSLIGFTDIHSGIRHYDVGVGSSFGARDMTNGTLVRFHHVTSKQLEQFDDATQKMVLTGSNITKNLSAGMYIYVSVTGTNGVGLESDVLQKKFRLLAGGGLALIRQCRAELCEGHCVCSPQNTKCPRSTVNCSIIETDSVNLTVFDVIDFREDSPLADIDYSPSTCVIAARWKLNPSTTITPISYDVAVGLASKAEPDGVKMKDNIIWRYVGLRNHAVHTRGQHEHYLDDNVKYSFFVKAWISRTEYTIFKSDGVHPSARPPALAKKQAAHVKDCRKDDVNKGTHIAKDVDLYNRTTYFCVSWKNAFLDKTSDHWDRYYVSLSTFPGGEDIKPQQETTSSYMEFHNLSLTPGRKYYSNVRACNKAGLCNERHSDGVIIDLEPPLAGVVLDGPGLHDEQYQNRTHLVAAHWNGFVDLGSAIHHYMWCAGTTQETGNCNVWPWTNVGLHTRIRKSTTSHLPAGRKIYNKVYAVDAAGHRSLVAVSNGVTVDNTPPVILTKLQFGDNTIYNPSFEEDHGINITAIANLTASKSSEQIKGWQANNTAIALSVNEASLVKGGRQFLFLIGSLYQKVAGLVVGERYIVELYVSQIQVPQFRNPTQGGRVGTLQLPNGEEYVLKARNSTGHHETTSDGAVTNWFKHIYYFKAESARGNVIISTVGPGNAIAIDDISIKQVQDGNASMAGSEQMKSSMHVQYVFTADWTSLHVAWEFEDKESPIVEYKVAVGTRIGDSRLYGYKSVALNTFVQLTNLSLTHDSTVFVTVIARNAAGLSSFLASGGIKVDMTPPVIHYVWDGDKEGQDTSYQDTPTITAQWKATDPESGIQYCEYGIGATPGSVAIKPFIEVPQGTLNISHTLSEPVPVIYTSVRCHNFAGGTSTMTSNGVGITRSKPSVKNAVVRILTRSETVYPTQENAVCSFQSQADELFLQWSGFDDPSGIDGYEIKVIGKGVWDQTIHVPDGGMTYMKVTDLGMIDNNTYLVEVRAVSVVGKKSDKVGTKVTIMRQPPMLTGSAPNLNWIVINKTFAMDWSTLFAQESVFSYEVSLGTILGGADIKQWLETKSSNMTFELESDWQAKTTLHATITAINSAGLYTTTVYPIDRNAIKVTP